MTDKPKKMREIPKRLTLQELRLMQQAASKGVEEPPKASTDIRNTAATQPNPIKRSTIKTTGSISKVKGSNKTKSRSSNKMPRQFSCRKCAPAHGALVIPDGETSGPLLLPADSASAAASAVVSPEVQAYRTAAAAHRLKLLRGGLKYRSSTSGSRDPRFSSLCGELNVASCSKAYSFVEEQQQELMKQLQYVVKTGRVPRTEAGQSSSSSSGREQKASASEREQAKKQLQRLKSQQQQRERRAAEAALKASFSRTERERIAATGKRPHYVSKKKLREMLREQQQQSTSNKKKVKQEIRQRKKALAKERKRNFVPQRRRTLGNED